MRLFGVRQVTSAIPQRPFFYAIRPADSKMLSHQRRTANSDGKDKVGKQALCRLLFMADGKECFAYSGGRQRGVTAKYWTSASVSPLGG